MIVEVPYKEIGIVHGRQAPETLVYGGRVCRLRSHNDENAIAQYENDEPVERPSVTITPPRAVPTDAQKAGATSGAGVAVFISEPVDDEETEPPTS